MWKQEESVIMTNQGEVEKNKLMNAEHNYDTD